MYLNRPLWTGNLIAFGGDGEEAGSTMEIYTVDTWVVKELAYPHSSHTSVTLPCK